MDLIILDSARRHGVGDADLFHAIRNAIGIYEQDDDVMMHIGPSQSGELLEVGVIAASDHPGIRLVIHGMPARSKYLKGV